MMPYREKGLRKRKNKGLINDISKSECKGEYDPTGFYLRWGNGYPFRGRQVIRKISGRNRFECNRSLFAANSSGDLQFPLFIGRQVQCFAKDQSSPIGKGTGPESIASKGITRCCIDECSCWRKEKGLHPPFNAYKWLMPCPEISPESQKREQGPPLLQKMIPVLENDSGPIQLFKTSIIVKRGTGNIGRFCKKFTPLCKPDPKRRSEGKPGFSGREQVQGKIFLIFLESSFFLFPKRLRRAKKEGKLWYDDKPKTQLENF